jgi:hypothetical protein
MCPNHNQVPSTAAHLIRTVDGIETPAPGTWMLGAGQPVTIDRTRRRRRRRCEGRVIEGALTIGDDIASSTLSFVLGRWAPDLGEPVFAFEGRMVSADEAGRWRFAGWVRFGDSSAVASVDVAYRGVYRFGAHPVAWLTVHGRADIARSGSGRNSRRLDWTTDVNAEAPLIEQTPPG